MERKVILDKRFNKSLLSVLIYLHENWSKKVSDEFADLVKYKLKQIEKYPETGMPSRYKNVRSMPVGKHNRIYYFLDSKAIKILLLRDMRMNPTSNPYEK